MTGVEFDRNLKAFPQNMSVLSETDFLVLSKWKCGAKVYPKISEERFEWLANNATTKSELEYFHMFEGCVIADQPV